MLAELEKTEAAAFVGSRPVDPRQWYVVEATETGGSKAQGALAFIGLTIWRPFDVIRARKADKRGKPRKDISVPRFGRYFFIRCVMTDDLQEAIRHITGVQEILCACGTDSPAVVPDAQIAFLRSNPSAPKPDAIPGVKDRVRVNAGPFEAVEGVVRSVDKRGVLKVELELFGRQTPVVLEASQVTVTKQAKPHVILPLSKRRAG